MRWRDQIAANSVAGQAFRGSFRGAEFLVPDDELEFGRRTNTHEYPLRDEPYVEDLGRKARRFQIDVFVAGENCLTDRDALIVAIEQAGPGLLVHPWYGVLNVTVVEARVSNHSNQGGKITFSLTCIEAGENLFPTSETDIASSVAAAATAASSSALTDFAARFSVANLPDAHLAEIEADLALTLHGVEAVVAGVTSSAAAAIRAPYNMGALIVGGVQQIAVLIAEPLDALRLYQNLFDAGLDNPAVPLTTTTREQQAQSVDAQRRLVQRAAIAGAAQSSAAANYASLDDAITVRDRLLAAIDSQLEATDVVTGAPIDDVTFQAFTTLRAAVSEDLTLRGGKLPRLTRYTPSATLPALVIAHQLYGDATREAEIVSRNKIRHPGFVPGGRALEVFNA